MRLNVWIKNIHKLPKVSRRILHSKWRILQSLIPDERADILLQRNSLHRAVHFAKFEGSLGFSVPSIILVDLLGNTCLLAWVQKVLVFIICDWWISVCFVCFMFQGSLLCDRPVSGNSRLIFLILVTCKNKATSASFLPSTKKSTHHWDFLCYSWAV